MTARTPEEQYMDVCEKQFKSIKDDMKNGFARLESIVDGLKNSIYKDNGHKSIQSSIGELRMGLANLQDNIFRDISKMEKTKNGAKSIDYSIAEWFMRNWRFAVIVVLLVAFFIAKMGLLADSQGFSVEQQNELIKILEKVLNG